MNEFMAQRRKTRFYLNTFGKQFKKKENFIIIYLTFGRKLVTRIKTQ